MLAPCQLRSLAISRGAVGSLHLGSFFKLSAGLEHHVRHLFPIGSDFNPSSSALSAVRASKEFWDSPPTMWLQHCLRLSFCFELQNSCKRYFPILGIVLMLEKVQSTTVSRQACIAKCTALPSATNKKSYIVMHSTKVRMVSWFSRVASHELATMHMYFRNLWNSYQCDFAIHAELYKTRMSLDLSFPDLSFPRLDLSHGQSQFSAFHETSNIKPETSEREKVL